MKSAKYQECDTIMDNYNPVPPPLPRRVPPNRNIYAEPFETNTSRWVEHFYFSLLLIQTHHNYDEWDDIDDKIAANYVITPKLFDLHGESLGRNLRLNDSHKQRRNERTKLLRNSKTSTLLLGSSSVRIRSRALGTLVTPTTSPF